MYELKNIYVYIYIYKISLHDTAICNCDRLNSLKFWGFVLQNFSTMAPTDVPSGSRPWDCGDAG